MVEVLIFNRDVDGRCVCTGILRSSICMRCGVVAPQTYVCTYEMLSSTFFVPQNHKQSKTYILPTLSNYPNLIPLVPSHFPPLTSPPAFGYFKFLESPSDDPAALLPANLIPISGFHMPGTGGGGAAAALVGVGAVSGSSDGAGAL